MPSCVPRIRRRGGRGSTYVESALVLSVVIFTLIGIVDIGQVLVLHQGLVERVRVGARWGVVNTFDETKIKNVVVYNASQPAEGATPLLNLTTDLVSATQYAADTPEWRIAVRIDNYPFHFFSPLIVGDYTAKPIVMDMSGEGMGAIN